jgi:hypothetical protein
MLKLNYNREKVKKVPLHFTLSVEEKKDIKKLAEFMNFSLADFIKYCINYTVDKEGLMDVIEND